MCMDKTRDMHTRNCDEIKSRVNKVSEHANVGHLKCLFSRQLAILQSVQKFIEELNLIRLSISLHLHNINI